MAASLPDLIALRDALFKARLSGVREVQDSNGERIVYRSDAEMSAALIAADRAIQAAQSPGSRSTIKFSTSKGL